MVMLTFLAFDRENPFWSNLVQKIKIVSLNLCLMPRLIRLCRIQFWCLLFLLSTGNTINAEIWSKNSKLSLWAEIRHLNRFEYADFNGNVRFFHFSPELSFLGKFGQKSLKCSLRHLQSFKKYLRQTLVFMWNSEFLARIEKNFILTGRLSTSL